MRKQRFFVDTSVFGGVEDRVFKKESRLLFDMVRNGRVICVYSDLVEDELAVAPENVRLYFETLPDEQLDLVGITPDVKKLAEAYISEGVISAKNRTDCLHIAAATVHKADVLVSWNFKHIVNDCKKKGYNDVNKMLGYPAIEILSPRDIVSYKIGGGDSEPLDEVREAAPDYEYRAVRFFRLMREADYRKERGLPYEKINAYLDEVRYRADGGRRHARISASLIKKKKSLTFV